MMYTIGSTADKDLQKEIRGAISQTLKQHGVITDDVAVPDIVEGPKNDQGKPVKIAKIEVRAQSSSANGMKRDLFSALHDKDSALSKAKKLTIDVQSTSIEVLW